jgi:hypothetical protein
MFYITICTQGQKVQRFKHKAIYSALLESRTGGILGAFQKTLFLKRSDLQDVSAKVWLMPPTPINKNSIRFFGWLFY